MSLERIFPVPRANENDVEHRRLLADALNEIARRLYAEAATDGPLLLAGRPGGQVAHGGTASGDDLELHSNTAEDGLVNVGDTLYVDEANSRVGVGTNAPAVELHASGAGNTRARIASSTAGAVGLELVNSAQSWITQIISGQYRVFDSTNSKTPVLILPNAASSSLLLSSSGVSLLANGGTFGGAVGAVFLANRTTAPTSNPTGGGITYCEAGAKKYRGSGGSVTTLAPA